MINLSNVKAITHNNKEVTKIEDNLGRILWQKSTPPTRITDIYYRSGSSTYKLDIINKTMEKYTTNNGVGNGNQIIGIGNDLVYWTGTTVRDVVFDDVNKTCTYTNSAHTLPAVNNAGNCSYNPGLSNKFYVCGYSNITAYEVNSDYTYSSKTFTNYVGGNCVFKWKGNYYGVTNVNDSYLYKYENDDWVLTNIPNPSSSTWDIWVYGDRLLYDHGTDHLEYDENNNTWNTHTWSGAINFDGCRVFNDNIDTYILAGARQMYIIDMTTDTISSYWTWTSSVGPAMRADYLISSKGTLQLAQNTRPKLP